MSLILLGFGGLSQSSRDWLGSSVSHLCPGARGLGESVILDIVESDLAESLLRCSPLCWKTPKRSLTP